MNTVDEAMSSINSGDGQKNMSFILIMQGSVSWQQIFFQVAFFAASQNAVRHIVRPSSALRIKQTQHMTFTTPNKMHVNLASSSKQIRQTIALQREVHH
jgi:hypothetical protein